MAASGWKLVAAFGTPHWLQRRMENFFFLDPRPLTLLCIESLDSLGWGYQHLDTWFTKGNFKLSQKELLTLISL
jgi:hypothetical protein